LITKYWISEWFTPNVDMIGPDLYRMLTNILCGCEYARDDNPLFVPESFGSPNMLYAIANYNCMVTFWIFAYEPCLWDTMVIPEVSKRLILSIVYPDDAADIKIPGTGKIQAILQPERRSPEFDFEGYTGIVEFAIGGRICPRNRPTIIAAGFGSTG